MRFKACLPPLHDAARRLFVASIAIGLGLMLAACSNSREAHQQSPSWVAAAPPAPVPTREVAYEPLPGDPIQERPLDPARRPTVAADDPSEPFSPNYGGSRGRPPVKVSDFDVPTHEPEPEQRSEKRAASPASRAYFRPARTAAAE